MELAITRNASEALQIAQLGIELKAATKSSPQSGLRPDAHHVGSARSSRTPSE
jgi:hypothetical protein